MKILNINDYLNIFYVVQLSLLIVEMSGQSHFFIMVLGTPSKKKHVIFSDIVTIAFDPLPP